MISRKKFIQSQGATCRNWYWSWSFVNEAEKIIIFGQWDSMTKANTALIFSKNWKFDSTGRKLPGYDQSREHIRLIEEEGYTLKTFRLIQPEQEKHIPNKIRSFEQKLKTKKLKRINNDWFAIDDDNQNYGIALHEIEKIRKKKRLVFGLQVSKSTSHGYLLDDMSMNKISIDKKKESTIDNITIWYGTNRKQILKGNKVIDYSEERDSTIHYGSCEVDIPESHKFGSTGSSFFRRLLSFDDDRIRVRRTCELSEAQYWVTIASCLSELSHLERTAIVFIHGYNVNFQDAAIRTAQIGYDLGMNGATAFFSWPSRGGLKSYMADEATIEASEKPITEFLAKFAKHSGAEKVHVIAHSMGNRGLLRALQRYVSSAQEFSGVTFGQIILAAPDIDVDVFKQLAEVYSRLSDRTTLYVSARDKAVALSEIAHDAARVGFVPPVTIIPTIDTVEVSNIDLSLLGHGYIATAEAVLYDMYNLIQTNTEPSKRIRLKVAKTSEGGIYWKILP